MWTGVWRSGAYPIQTVEIMAKICCTAEIAVGARVRVVYLYVWGREPHAEQTYAAMLGGFVCERVTRKNELTSLCLRARQTLWNSSAPLSIMVSVLAVLDGA